MPHPAVFIRYGMLLLWALTAVPAWGADASTLVIDPQKQWQYAELLFEEGRFRQAAEEYERFAFFFPQHPDRRKAVLMAGRAFMRAGEALAALQDFNSLVQNGALDDIAVEAYFLMAETYLQLQNPSQAILQLNNLITLSEQAPVKDRAYLRIGWIHVEQMDWSGAKQAWKRISPQGRQTFRIDSLETALGQADQLPMKRPAVAGLLSVVPGAGQLYCGRYEDALAALLVNGGLIWAAYESFDNDLNGLGSLLAVAGLGFYTANIYGAVSSAHKYNQTQRQRFVEQLKRNVVIRIEPESAPSGVSADALVIRWVWVY
ncbi:MAG: hypothetical protein C4519_23100 [Desulfobacteraceae bacterium]|nr:MAG: hypothetical protein C4519_23100 [Desulfobacteraceae bacterium]